MNTLKRIFSLLLIATACGAAAILTPAPVFAADKIVLKDGKVIEGEIVREVDGVVWLKTATGTTMYTPSDYTKIERDAKPAEETAKPAATPGSKDQPKPREVKTGVPRAAVISLEGDVGLEMTADSLEKCIPLLEEEKIDIVALRVKSGGGALSEIQKISDTIHLKLKKKFRVVAWIESAISAAAMSSHCIEEIYFMPRGNYGACTGWYGAGLEVKGRQLEEVLQMMEKISKRGNYDPKIMRAMQISGIDEKSKALEIAPPYGALSATVDETTGKATFYQDATSGEVVLNPGVLDILTFNSQTAMKVKFAKGVAGTTEELGKAMGLSEVEWVGKIDPKCTYPVSKAEAHMLAFRDRTAKDRDGFNRYVGVLETYIALAKGEQDKTVRGTYIAKAREALSQIRSMVKNNPNFANQKWGSLEAFNAWVDQIEKILKELAR